jgi:hypothetical protein
MALYVDHYVRSYEVSYSGVSCLKSQPGDRCSEGFRGFFVYPLSPQLLHGVLWDSFSFFILYYWPLGY